MRRKPKEKNSDKREILAYSLMPFGTSTIYGVTSTALNLYFTDVLKLSLKRTSFIALISRVWDAINDPMMGMIVDRTNTKNGKCRPYILWMSWPLALATALLFFPANFGDTGNFIFAWLAYMLYYTVYTAVDIPFQGMTPLVFPEDKKRVKALSFGNIIGSTGSILPSVLFFTLAGMWGREQEKQGYFFAAVVFALMAGAAMFTSYFGIKEKVQLPPKKMNYIQGLRIVFTDKNLIILMVLILLNAAIGAGGMFLPYFAKWNCIDVIPVDRLSVWIQSTFNLSVSFTSEGLLTPLLQIGSGISYMLSMALIPAFLKRMDKKTLLVRASLLGAAANILVYIIGIWLVPYNTVAGVLLFTGMRFFSNFPIGIGTVLLIAMFSDATDDLEMRHGERLEGTVFSFKSLISKISGALLNALVLAVVNAFHYDADAMTAASNNLTQKLVITPTAPNFINGVNYTSLMNVIFFMLTAAAAVGLILQIIPLRFYHVDEKAQAEKLEQYREERQQLMQEELDRINQAGA